jgi:hypothetical protein
MTNRPAGKIRKSMPVLPVLTDVILFRAECVLRLAAVRRTARRPGEEVS